MAEQEAQEAKQKIADLLAELQGVKTAKIAADKRVMELEIEAEALQGEVTSLTEDVQESRRTLEYRVSECREAARQELGRAHECEIGTHEELQRVLSERLADREQTIADLRDQLNNVGDARVVPGRPLKLPALPAFQGGDKAEEGAYKQWLEKLGKYAELQHLSARDKLLQFELHLAGKAESIYAVLPPEEKETFEKASQALGKRVQPAKREALSSAQLLRRRQKLGESVDDFVRDFERLFEESYGHRADVDAAFKGVLKRDVFVQGLLLKWQEKVLPSAKTFADALHQARTAEEQERQLGLMHHGGVAAGKKDGVLRAQPGKQARGDKPNTAEQQSPQTGSSYLSRIQCYKCHGSGHFARQCPLAKKHASEASGGGGTSSGTSSTVRADEPENPSDQCQRLQREWVDAEFSRLAEVYTQGASVDTVSGALGPLYYATVSIAGSSVDALVDPGSSATIMSFDLFRMVGKGAGIPREAMRKPEITLRDYSRRPIPIFAVVDLEFEWQGNQLTAPVYLKSDQGPKGEPCLLGTNVVIPLGLMVPGPGVRPQKVGAGDTGTVRLVSAQRVPSRCGVVVDAIIEGCCKGPVMVEPVVGSSGIELECMVVEADSSGKVSLVITNPSPEVVQLDTGQCLGSVQAFCEWSSESACGYASEASECADVCSVAMSADADLEPAAACKRKEKLSRILGLGDEWEGVRQQVLEAHDVFALDEGERGDTGKTLHIHWANRSRFIC